MSPVGASMAFKYLVPDSKVLHVLKPIHLQPCSLLFSNLINRLHSSQPHKRQINAKYFPQFGPHHARSNVIKYLNIMMKYIRNICKSSLSLGTASVLAIHMDVYTATQNIQSEKS